MKVDVYFEGNSQAHRIMRFPFRPMIGDQLWQLKDKYEIVEVCFEILADEMRELLAFIKVRLLP